MKLVWFVDLIKHESVSGSDVCGCAEIFVFAVVFNVVQIKLEFWGV